MHRELKAIRKQRLHAHFILLRRRRIVVRRRVDIEIGGVEPRRRVHDSAGHLLIRQRHEFQRRDVDRSQPPTRQIRTDRMAPASRFIEFDGRNIERERRRICRDWSGRACRRARRIRRCRRRSRLTARARRGNSHPRRNAEQQRPTTLLFPPESLRHRTTNGNTARLNRRLKFCEDRQDRSSADATASVAAHMSDRAVPLRPEESGHSRIGL